MSHCAAQENKDAADHGDVLTSWKPSEHEPLLMSILDFPKALISLIGSYLPGPLCFCLSNVRVY